MGLRGRRLVPFAALSAEKYWYARSEDDVCFDVALLFAQDPNRSVRDEGYAIFKRSQRSYLSRRTVEAVGLLATSLREEVGDRVPDDQAMLQGSLQVLQELRGRAGPRLQAHRAAARRRDVTADVSDRNLVRVL